MTEFSATSEYLEKLRGDPSLAIISMQMAADEFGISRAAIEQRVRAGSLEGVRIGKTRWVRASSVMKQTDADKAEVYRLRRYLERLASAGELIDYGTLMKEFGMSSTIPADRSRIGRLLGLVSRQTWEERDVLLSVLVVRKGSTNPGPGFFELAENIDEKNYLRAKTDAAYVNAQINRVFGSYGFL